VTVPGGALDEGRGGNQREEIAQRLQRLEEALEGTEYGATSRMARRLEIGFTRWHNAKSGGGLSQNLTLILLEQIPGLSADWLLKGRPEGLSCRWPVSLARPTELIERGRSRDLLFKIPLEPRMRINIIGTSHEDNVTRVKRCSAEGKRTLREK
jgi:hypothetical protein